MLCISRVDVILLSLINDSSGVAKLAISGIPFIKGRESVDIGFSSAPKSLNGVNIGERVWMDLSRVVDLIEVPVSVPKENRSFTGLGLSSVFLVGVLTSLSVSKER